MAHPQTPQGPEAFGKYVLERRLAVGGAAEVYLARAEGGRRLVIKRLLPGLRGDPAAEGMFAQEAKLHQAVRHPNVVELYEAGEVDGEPYLAMHYVDGTDASRLLRRAQNEEKTIPEALAVYVGRSVCEALGSVHGARDEAGRPLGIIHRDVTPSNIYLSSSGAVLLGDFGIAREALKLTRPQVSGAVLKGKYGYLAPEQVSNEPFDHRADLFACAVVTAELLLGKPLFGGAGQLAVLLAIRDGRLDALHAGANRISPGLFAVLLKALSRDPAGRYPSARALSEALRPHEGPLDQAQRLLCDWVAWARNTQGLARQLGGALIESEARMKQLDPDEAQAESAVPTVRRANEDELEPLSLIEVHDDETYEAAPVTARIDEIPSRVRFADGQSLSSVSFAHLIEMIVTGEVGPHDEVDLMGQGYRCVADIDLLARHLPAENTTRNLDAPAPPDEVAILDSAQLLPLLGRLARGRETGFLLVEGSPSVDEPPVRREVYLQRGQLLHIASSEASELLGKSLVRRGLITANELDMALAVMSRFDGRLGDTLTSLGLIDAVDLFRAIEEQGRDRFVRMFLWAHGKAFFFRGVQPTKVEFPLDIDLLSLLLSAMELAYPNDAPITQSRPVLGRLLRRTEDPASQASYRGAPRAVLALLDVAGARGIELRQALARLSAAGLPPADALRAMYVAIAVGLCEIA